MFTSALWLTEPARNSNRSPWLLFHNHLLNTEELLQVLRLLLLFWFLLFWTRFDNFYSRFCPRYFLTFRHPIIHTKPSSLGVQLIYFNFILFPRFPSSEKLFLFRYFPSTYNLGVFENRVSMLNLTWMLSIRIITSYLSFGFLVYSFYCNSICVIIKADLCKIVIRSSLMG